MKCIGIDPSFKGMGIAVIDKDKKEIRLDELSVELSGGKFRNIAESSAEMTAQVLAHHKEDFEGEILMAMEQPPSTGFYTEKLWALDTTLYRCLPQKPYMFPVAYLTFLHGKRNTKDDTINLMNEVISLFTQNGYKLICSEKKMTSNQADALLYATRMFMRSEQTTEEGLSEIGKGIYRLKERYAEFKEEEYNA